ncbi:MAG: hypothetical protein NTZ73_02465 [Candidatus Diapherotrites archaeon]|nr:hypothetical protein [Candidatus Diapherotrites archaeon]
MMAKKSRPKLPTARSAIEAAARSGKGIRWWQRLIHPRLKNYYFEIAMGKKPGKSPVDISHSRGKYWVKYYPETAKTMIHTHTFEGKKRQRLANSTKIENILDQDALSMGDIYDMIAENSKSKFEIVSITEDGNEVERYFFKKPKNMEEARKKFELVDVESYLAIGRDLARAYREIERKKMERCGGHFDELEFRRRIQLNAKIALEKFAAKKVLRSLEIHDREKCQRILDLVSERARREWMRKEWNKDLISDPVLAEIDRKLFKELGVLTRVKFQWRFDIQMENIDSVLHYNYWGRLTGDKLLSS